MKKVRLYESFHGIDEAKRGTIHKAVKAGNYPATIVVIENGKVVKQEIVNTPEAVPATFNVLQKEYPKAKIHVEDRGGQTLFVEAYDGNMADFKYEFPQVFVDVTGNPEKAIKKIKKAGKGFEVRTSAYMSEEEMEEVADALGMVLVDYEKNSNMAISVFESVVNESEWVAYISYPRGKKLVKTLKSHRAAVMWNNKNVDSILMQDDVEGVGIMSKEMWDNNEAEWAVESIVTEGKIKMNNLDWGKTTAERNANLDKYDSLKTEEEKEEFLKSLKNESVVTEGRSIKKIQGDYDKVVQKLLDTKESWKDCKASGDTKGEAKCLAELKDLTARKKALISELDAAIGLKDVDAELAESVNESIQYGSYYFPKAAVSSDMQPAKGETKYAVICHNTVQMGNNIMYLKAASSKIGQNFEAHVLSVHDTEEEAYSAYVETVKYDGGKTASCVSYAYGTLTSKGSNLPFDEIGGERKTIK